MAVLMSNVCKSSYNRLTYIFNQSPHNDIKTSHRVLACSGNNVRMLHNPDGSLTVNQSGVYLEKQFHQSLKRAFNPKRRIQCQSIIISFSNDEFDTSNLSEQASQALRLVQGYAKKYFGDAQSVSAVQCDGNGGRLHVHLLINSVKPNGKTIATSRFSVFKMRKNINSYLNTNFERVTGRSWVNSFDNSESRHDLSSLPNRSKWQSHLKKTIDLIKTEVDSVKDFLAKLSQVGVTVTERQHGKSWTYHGTIKTSKGTKKISARDFYQRVDKKTGDVLTTRGLGQSYTKQALEKYWSNQKETQQLLSPLRHSKKEVDNNEGRKQTEERDQLAKIKTRAAEARAQIERQRELNRLNLLQLKAAKVEEQRLKRQSQREAGQATRQQPNRKHTQSVAEQERLREREKQRLRSKQQNAKSSGSKDAGPDF